MANFITIFRVFLVFIAASLLFYNNSTSYIVALVLVISAFVLDGVDGWVARKFNQSSKLGAVLDIMSDRIAENTFWVVFAVLGWLPVCYPIIALTRGFITDGLRSVAMEQGYTAFGKTSMQEDKWSYIICCSKGSRILYAVAKVLAFIILIVAYIPGLDEVLAFKAQAIANILAVTAIEFCVIRGLPVLFESKKLFRQVRKIEKV